MDDNIVLGVIFITLLLLLLVAGIFISIYTAGKQRMQQEIKIGQMELKYEKELRQVEAEVGEGMMERFAQELHDNIGHVLTCMRITIENKKIDEPLLEAPFMPIENYLEEATEQLRLLSRSLNTEYVSNLGLKGAIMLEVERVKQLNRSRLYCDMEDGSASMDKDKELIAFRIFQEMMHNSIKHSGAKDLHVLFRTIDGLELRVADNGKGFVLEEILNSPRASGLKIMMKRARMAGFECAIDTSPGNGCTYTLRKEKRPKDT